MGRFIFGVLVAVFAVWGYDRVFGDSAEASSEAGRTGTVFHEGPDPGGASSDARVQEPDTGAGHELRTEPGGALAATQTISFASLRNASGGDRDRIVAALHRGLREAPNAVARLAILGADNAFLHSPEGRVAASSIQEELAQQDAWTGVRASTQLLELVADGSIEPLDGEALATLARLRQRHDELVRRTVFDPADLTGARRHEVRSGEVLVTIARSIARAMNIPMQAGTLQLVNRISNPNVIRVGQVLKVPVEPIRVVVFLRSYLMAVYVGDVIVRSYRCAHGKDGHETPVANFTVGETVERPDWPYGGESIAYGDPRNPLGSHFVKFIHETYSGFGAHGTNEPNTIGTRASLGCIRLGAEDIVEFATFVPRGASVEVRR